MTSASKDKDPKVFINSYHPITPASRPDGEAVHKLFVYDTLQSGFGPHAILATHGSQRIGRGSYNGQQSALVELGQRCGIIPDAKGPNIEGELYRVTRSCLARLDFLHYPSFRRVKLRVWDTENWDEHRTWCYVLALTSIKSPTLVKDGNWAEYGRRELQKYIRTADKCLEEKLNPTPKPVVADIVTRPGSFTLATDAATMGAVCSITELPWDERKDRIKSLQNLERGKTMTEVVGTVEYTWKREMDGRIKLDSHRQVKPTVEPLFQPARTIGFGPPFTPPSNAEKLLPKELGPAPKSAEESAKVFGFDPETKVMTPLNGDTPAPESFGLDIYQCRHCGQPIIEPDEVGWVSCDNLSSQCIVAGAHKPSKHPLQ